MDSEAAQAKAEVFMTWAIGLPVALGLLAAWASGHLVAHWTVKAVASGMGMTSRAGHRHYYRKGVDYRGGHRR